MKLVNRSVVIIKPKQPLVDWVNRTPEVRLPKRLSLADMRNYRTVLMVPLGANVVEALAYVDPIKPYLFEMQLNLWYKDPRVWPRERSNAAFDEWFELEIHSLVVDLVEYPLFREGDAEWDKD